jgi:ABC-type hemin transport system substrate-binding protein
VERKRAISAIEFLNAPMLRVQLTELKSLYKGYQQTQSIMELIAALEAMRNTYGVDTKSSKPADATSTPKLERTDLRLICFDVLSSD